MVKTKIGSTRNSRKLAGARFVLAGSIALVALTIGARSAKPAGVDLARLRNADAYPSYDLTPPAGPRGIGSGSICGPR